MTNPGVIVFHIDSPKLVVDAYGFRVRLFKQISHEQNDLEISIKLV